MSYRPSISSTQPSRLSNTSGSTDMHRPSQGGDVWYLEPISHEGTRYLVDRATGHVYKETPGDYPQLAGRLNAQGRVELRQKNTASDLFHALDTYLKTNQVRFRDLFAKYDTDRSGQLEGDEVRRLVKELLPSANEHEMRYFWAMMDTNGDGGVSQEEFLTAAKECLAAEKAAAERGREINDALGTVQRYMQNKQDEARAMFMSLDSRNQGRLSPNDQLAFFKACNHSFSSQQLRLLMMHVRDFSPYGDGSLSLHELMRAFNVHKVQHQAAGSGPASPAHHHTSTSSAGGYTSGPTSSSGPVTGGNWELEEVKDATGKTFLLDNETKVVYHPLRSSNAWPEVYGKVDSRGQVVAIERKSEGGLFAALDRHLKTAQVRFRDVFNKYAKARDYLDPDALLDMLYDLLPTLTKGDLYYFQVMLDVNGDGRVEYDEFLSMVKEGMAVEQGQQAATTADYSGLNKLSAWLSRNTTEAKRLYDGLTQGKTYLRYPEFNQFLQRALPTLTSNEKRTIFTYLASMDSKQEGHVTYRGLTSYFYKPTVKGASTPAHRGSAGGYGASSSPPVTQQAYGGAHTHSTGPARLRHLRVGSKNYLLDTASNKVYTDEEYPEYVGTWDGYEVRAASQASAGQLFQTLDRYLKDAKVRAKDLFLDFDKTRKGYLNVTELRQLIKALMSDVSEADVRYFQAMIDQNGDNRIEWDEFIDTAKACMEDERRGKDHTDVTTALYKVKQYLVNNRSSAEQLFRKQDSLGTGVLEPLQIANMFRSAIPGITASQMRHLLTHIHKIARHQDGRLSFNELMSALRALDIDSASSGGAYTGHTGSGSMGASPSRTTTVMSPVSGSSKVTGDASVAWSLEDWYDPRGDAYLIDRKSSIVYKNSSDWPQPVGVLSGGRLQPKKTLRPGDLFTRLDSYLKTAQVRLGDLFNKYDGNRDGELTLSELAKLLRDLRLQDVTNADILYFQALMDVDGNGNISQSELLSTAKSVQEIDAYMREAMVSGGSGLPKDVADLLDRVSRYITDNLDSMKTRWMAADASGNGFLEPHELASFLRGLIKGLSAREQHYLLTHLAGMDVTGSGTISFQELCISLRAVAPRTPKGVVHRTGFAAASGALKSPTQTSMSDSRRDTYPSRDSATHSSGYGQGTGSRESVSTRRTVQPFNKTWRLNDYEYRGKYYLIDPQTGLLYHDAPLSEWPHLVGRVDTARGTVSALGQDAATKFFTQLDAYLKDSKTRFRDVFNSYDTGRRGALGPRELGRLVRDVTPEATDAQIKYFALVLDANGDQRITEEEILTAAKDILAKLKTEGTQGARAALLDASTLPTIAELSDTLYRAPHDAKSSFDSFDTKGQGVLEYDQLPAFFKDIKKRLREDEIRSLVTLVHLYDTQSEGQVSFQEIMIALRAVDCVSGKGTHKRGFQVPTSGRQDTGRGAYDTGRDTHSASSRGGAGEVDFPSVWELEAYKSSVSASYGSPRDTSSRTARPQYLIDPRTQYLYSVPGSAAEWPVHLGKVDRSGRLTLYTGESGAEALKFFKVLDSYLKEEKVRFNDLFKQFDRDRSGHLDSAELRRLMQGLMPRATEPQLAYFQAMLDCGGQVELTSDEFLSAARQCMGVEGDVQRQELPPEVVKQLQSLSARLYEDKRQLRSLFDKYDDRRRGRLEPRQLLRLVSDIHPTLSKAALRYIAVLFNSLDSDGDGLVEPRELVQVLHAVELRTPEYTYKPGTWFTRGTASGGRDRDTDTRHSPSRGQARREPVMRSLDLDTFEYERKRYLLDRASGVVYEWVDGRDPCAWPRPLGVLDKHTRHVAWKPPAATSAEFFSSLDRYLKKERVRFSELFRRYDRNGNGELDRSELAQLLKDFLGANKVTAADVSYFTAMLDLERNRSISEQEFLAVAKDFVAVESLSSSGSAAEEVRYALSEVSRALSEDREGGYAAFERVDREGSGCVDHQGVMDIVKRVCPNLRTREVHFVLTHLHTLDADKAGKFTYNELLVLFRALPVNLPGGGRLAGGFPKAKGKAGAADSRAVEGVLSKGRGDTRDTVRDIVELKDVRVAGKLYLHDPVTGYVYEHCTGMSDYPAIVGKIEGSGSASLRKFVFTVDNDLFTYLDHYLKENQVKLKDVFRQLDRDRSGALSTRELESLVSTLLSNPTDAELAYFQVMLDENGDGSVTYQELVKAIQDCWSQGKSVAARNTPAVAECLSRVSTAIKTNTSRAHDSFTSHSVTCEGQLTLPEVASFLRTLLPRLDTKEMRYVLAHLHFLDTQGDGTYTFTDLLHCLNVVDLRLPGNALIRGGAFPKPKASVRQPLGQGNKGIGAGETRTRAPLNSSLRHSDRDSSSGGAQDGLVKEWVLQEWSAGHSGDGRMLLDTETGLVYTWDKEDMWPRLAGVRTPDGSFTTIDMGAAHQFFKALDKALKTHKVKLSDFLALFELDEDTAQRGLDSDEFTELVYRLLPTATQAQVSFLEAVIDLDGDRLITAEEILEAFKQLKEVGPRVTKLDDPVLLTAFNKLSDTVAKDQKRALKVFTECDLDRRGSLQQRELARFLMHLAPQLKPMELCGLQTHFHLMDANCNGAIEFKELLTGLRAIPVRVGSRVYQRQQFKAKRGVSSAGRLGTPTKTSGLNQTLTKSMGGYGTSPLRKLTSHSRHASRDGSMLGSDDEEGVERVMPLKGRSMGANSLMSAGIGAGDREIVMELHESQGGQHLSQSLLTGTSGMRKASHAHTQGSVLVDPQSGLLYAPPGAGAKGAWPRLLGYSDGETGHMVKIEPLSTQRVFSELAQSLAVEREVLVENFARIASKAGHAASLSRKGEPQLDVSSCLALLDRMMPEGINPHTWSVLRVLLLLLVGEQVTPSKLLKALSIVADAQQRVVGGSESGLPHLLMAMSTALSTQIKTVLATAKQISTGGVPQHLGPHDVMDLLSGVAPTLLHSRVDVCDKAGVALWLYYHAPDTEEEGLLHVADLVKAFRACRCKLPDGRTLPPGLSMSQSLSASHQGTRSLISDMAVDVRPLSPRTGYGSMRGPMDSLSHEARYIMAQQSQAHPDMVSGIRTSQAGIAGMALPSGRHSLTWQANRETTSSAGQLTMSQGGAATLNSSGRKILPLPSPTQPRVFPQRRMVTLQPYKGPEGTQLAHDPDTGLLYRTSSREEWPELYGKASATGRILPAATTDVFKVFEALRRISGDESRLLQVFRSYDTNQNNSLDLPEVMQMCRQLAGLAYHEACFVQAMLDTDGNNKLSFEEFVNGVRATTTLLDNVTRTERDVLSVLQRASSTLSSDLQVFWAAYALHDRDGNGYLDISELYRMFKSVFQGIGSYEARVLVAYVFMMDVERDGFVRPDELLQALRVIPMKSPTGVIYRPGFPVASSKSPLDTLSPTRKSLQWPASKHSTESGPHSHVPYPEHSVRHPHMGPHTEAGWPRPSSPHAHQGSSYPSAHVTSPSPAPSSPSSAVPYVMSAGPGQAPLVGYLVPYQPELYTQLVSSASRSATASPVPRAHIHDVEVVEVLDEFARERDSAPQQTQFGVQHALPSRHPLVPPYAGQAPPDMHRPSSPVHGSVWGQGRGSRPTSPPLHGSSSPPHMFAYHREAWGARDGYAAPHPGPVNRAYSSGGMVGEGMSGYGGEWLQDAPPLQQWRTQQQEIKQLGFSPSALSGAPNTSPPPAMWRSSSTLPGGRMSVMSDASPYGRRTNFGLFQELASFIDSRREAFYNHFMMASSPSSPSASPRGGPQHSQHRQGQPLGMVSKAAAAAVLQRAVPGASHADIRYFQIMLDAALPEHRALSLDDFEWAVRQGAAVERQVASQHLPSHICQHLAHLSSMFYSGTRSRVAQSFRDLDMNRSGTLSVQEQVLLLQSLMSLRPSEVMWISAALAHYNASTGRTGYLTFEELAEALVTLSQPQAQLGKPNKDTRFAHSQGNMLRHSTGGYPGASYGAHAGHPQDEGPYRGQGWTPQQQWGSPRDGAMPHSASPQAAAMATGVRFGVGGAGFGGRAVSTGGYDDSSAGGTGWQMGGGAAMPWKAGMSPRGVGDMGMYGGDRDGMGAAGYGAGYANLAPAGQAYFAWTHDSRQKILEKYFAEDHAKKMRLLEEQKRALDSQVALKKANLEAAQDIRKLETGMANLARQVEKNAYELTGQPPVQVCTLDQLTARISAAVEEAVKITRKRSLLEDPSTQAGVPPSYRPPPDMASLLEQLTSADWFARMQLPANMETLKLALAMRREMVELERMRELESHQAQWDLREAEQHHQRESHAQAVQGSLLTAQLHRLNVQAAELQARLLADAQCAAADAATLAGAAEAAAAAGAAPHGLLPVGSPSAAQLGHPDLTAGMRGMRLSPPNWQYEPGYQGTLGTPLSPGNASMPLVPRSTSD